MRRGTDQTPYDESYIWRITVTWEDFKAWIEPFIYGLVVGFFWHPFWQILKKIWEEARIAKREWSKSNGKSD
jgi:hypothetical protein